MIFACHFKPACVSLCVRLHPCGVQVPPTTTSWMWQVRQWMMSTQHKILLTQALWSFHLLPGTSVTSACALHDWLVKGTLRWGKAYWSQAIHSDWPSSLFSTSWVCIHYNIPLSFVLSFLSFFLYVLNILSWFVTLILAGQQHGEHHENRSSNPLTASDKDVRIGLHLQPRSVEH